MLCTSTSGKQSQAQKAQKNKGRKDWQGKKEEKNRREKRETKDKRQEVIFYQPKAGNNKEQDDVMSFKLLLLKLTHQLINGP